ncbi:MAG: phosphoribosyltransferase [Usitatibacter sp.]
MYFDDRTDVARQLADALRKFRGSHPLVLAIPRGAVPMGRIIADALGGDLDVALVRKLRAPGNEELAVGSVDETGWSYVAEYARDLGVDAEYLEREKDIQLDLMRRRRAQYTPGRESFDPAGRTCIVVDDGLATGATMIAALHSVRARAPSRLVAAVPVASRESLARIASLADEIVCLATPPDFHAVGQFYREFDAVSDAQVSLVLRTARPAASRTTA